GVPVVLYDAALLFENGLQHGLQGVVLVWTPERLQRSRLAARDGLTEAEVDARLEAQMPLSQKRALATWEVDNSGTLAETDEQVRRIWEKIRQGSGWGPAPGHRWLLWARRWSPAIRASLPSGWWSTWRVRGGGASTPWPSRNGWSAPARWPP